MTQTVQEKLVKLGISEKSYHQWSTQLQKLGYSEIGVVTTSVSEFTV
ncbi:MAG: hypothetical protein LEGION0403_FIIPPAGN_02838 [Legionella sp.]